MGTWVDKLERKIGRFAIPHLMRYIIIIYGLGLILEWTAPRSLSCLFFIKCGTAASWRNLEDFYISYAVTEYKPDLFYFYIIFVLFPWKYAGKSMGRVSVQFVLFYRRAGHRARCGHCLSGDRTDISFGYVLYQYVSLPCFCHSYTGYAASALFHYSD